MRYFVYSIFIVLVFQMVCQHEGYANDATKTKGYRFFEKGASLFDNKKYTDAESYFKKAYEYFTKKKSKGKEYKKLQFRSYLGLIGTYKKRGLRTKVQLLLSEKFNSSDYFTSLITHYNQYVKGALTYENNKINNAERFGMAELFFYAKKEKLFYFKTKTDNNAFTLIWILYIKTLDLNVVVEAAKVFPEYKPLWYMITQKQKLVEEVKDVDHTTLVPKKYRPLVIVTFEELGDKCKDNADKKKYYLKALSHAHFYKNWEKPWSTLKPDGSETKAQTINFIEVITKKLEAFNDKSVVYSSEAKFAFNRLTSKLKKLNSEFEGMTFAEVEVQLTKLGKELQPFFDRALTTAPDDPLSQMGMGICEAFIKGPDNDMRMNFALSYFDVAIALDPQPEFYLLRGAFNLSWYDMGKVNTSSGKAFVKTGKAITVNSSKGEKDLSKALSFSNKYKPIVNSAREGALTLEDLILPASAIKKWKGISFNYKPFCWALLKLSKIQGSHFEYKK